MPIRTLYAQDFPAYLEEERDRPGDLWVFHHLPKTAGTSLAMEIRPILGRSIAFNIDYLDETIPFRTKLDMAVDAGIEEARHTRPRFATGHIRGNHIDRLRRELAPVKVFTLLRDPVRRTISDYRYQLSPAHPLADSVRRDFPTLADFVTTEAGSDYQFRHLCLHKDEPVQELIERVDATYAFVGTIETYPLSFHVLMRLLGSRKNPTVRFNRGAPPNPDEEPSPDLTARIRAANQKDQAIYDYFTRRILNARNATWEALRSSLFTAG